MSGLRHVTRLPQTGSMLSTQRVLVIILLPGGGETAESASVSTKSLNEPPMSSYSGQRWATTPRTARTLLGPLAWRISSPHGAPGPGGGSGTTPFPAEACPAVRTRLSPGDRGSLDSSPAQRPVLRPGARSPWLGPAVSSSTQMAVPEPSAEVGRPPLLRAVAEGGSIKYAWPAPRYCAEDGVC